MNFAGLPRSVSTVATVAFVVGLGGCSPAQLPLLPQERSVPSGRQTADAAGSRADETSASDEGRALYESNAGQGHSPLGTSPDAGSSSADRDESANRKRSTDRIAGTPGTDVSSTGAAEPSVMVVERDGDTYEFKPAQSEQTDTSDATAVRLLRAATSALPSDEPRQADAGGPANRIELRRLVVADSEFELYGTAYSRDTLENYVAQLAAAPLVQTFEFAEESAGAEAPPIEFDLTGTYSNE